MKHKQNSFYLSFILMTGIAIPFAASADHGLTSDRSPLAYALLTGLMAVVIIGAVYNLWRTTRTYGGIIGNGLRRIGIGSLILVVVALDRLAINFNVGIISGLVLESYQSLVHDLLIIAALFFILVGYSKLQSVAKT